MNKLYAITTALLAMTLVGCTDQAITATTGTDTVGNVAQVTGDATTWPPVAEGELTLADNYFTENLVLILDMSGSMSESTCKDSSVSKYEASLNAVDEFIDSVPEDMNLGFVVFQGGVSEMRVPLAVNNRKSIRDVLAQVHPDGGTPLGSAVYDAYNMLLAQAQAQQGYGNYRMLIVTDGAAGDAATLQANIDYVATNTPIEVFTAGFCINEGHTLYQPGIVEFRTAGNIVELKDSMKAVLAESNSFDQALTFTK